MKVRCNQCMSIFDEENIKLNRMGREFCPVCGFGGALMDMPEFDTASYKGQSRNFETPFKTRGIFDDGSFVMRKKIMQAMHTIVLAIKDTCAQQFWKTYGIADLRDCDYYADSEVHYESICRAFSMIANKYIISNFYIPKYDATKKKEG